MSVLWDFICVSIQGHISCCLNATIIHHMKLISQKRINMVSFSNRHKSVQPTEAITVYIYFCPHSYSIYGPVPEEKQRDLSHILGASVPSDKSPSAPLSTALGCTWEPWLVTALRSFLFHLSRFRLNLKSIIHCSKPVLPNLLTQGEHIFSFPATM